jgi:zinc-ribbon domain
MAQRYCTNCGAELSEDDSFCGKCGRPVHETAKVSTPEADVPVPPPPAHDEATAMAGIPQDQGMEPTEWWQTPTSKVLGVIVAIVTVLVILANLNGGPASMSQSPKPSVAVHSKRRLRNICTMASSSGREAQLRLN